MNSDKKAYVYAFSAVIIWSSVASAFKIALSGSDFLQLLFWASLFSILVLSVAVFVQGKHRLFRRLTPEDYLRSALQGFFNPFLYYVVLFKAYSLLPAQEAQALNYTWPVMLVILSIPLLKHTVSVRDFVSIFICFFGVLVISTRGSIMSLDFSNPWGAVFALFSAVIWSIYWIFNTRNKMDDVIKLLMNFIFGFIFIALSVIKYSQILFPESKVIICMAYIGFFEMGITFLIWSKALRLTSNTAGISNLIFLTPFFSLLIIHFILGEKILVSTLLGLVLIISGIFVQKKSRNLT